MDRIQQIKTLFIEQRNASFAYRIADVLSGDYPERDAVYVCNTPNLIQRIGFEPLGIYMTQQHIKLCLAPETQTIGTVHCHNLPIDFMDNLPQYIAHPAMVLSSLTHPEDSIVLVTDCLDKKQRPIIIALKNDGKGIADGRMIECNVLLSTYGRNGFNDFLMNSIKTGGLLFCDIKKSRNLVVSAGLQLPGILAKCDSTDIIRRFDEDVNPFMENLLQDPKNLLPEKYGTKEYDGYKLLRYYDVDGRKCEYNYDVDDVTQKPYLAFTITTFPDGSSETFCYDANGNVEAIERTDNKERITYSYECEDGLTHEVSESHCEDLVVYGHTKHGTLECWSSYNADGLETRFKNNQYDENFKIAFHDDTIIDYDENGNVVCETYRNGTQYVKQYFTYDEVMSYSRAFPYLKLDPEFESVIKSDLCLMLNGTVNGKIYNIDGSYAEYKFDANSAVQTIYHDYNGRKRTRKEWLSKTQTLKDVARDNDGNDGFSM